MLCLMRRAINRSNPSYFGRDSHAFYRNAMLPVDYLSKFYGVAELLAIEPREFVRDLKKYELLEKRSPKEVESNVRLLLEYGFSSNYIMDYIHCVAISPLLLKSRLEVCEECGCPQSRVAPTVLQFHKFIHARPAILRAYGILQPSMNDENFLNRLLSYLDLRLEDCAENIEKTDTIFEIYRILQYSYISREVPKLKSMSTLDFRKAIRRFTSLQNYRKNINYLLEVLKFNKDEIRRFRSLLFSDHDNMITLLKSSHGIRIKEIIPKCPELLDVPKDRYDQVYDMVSKEKIDFSVFLKHPEHFNMSEKQFEYHFQNSITSPFFTPFKYHHLFPLLISRGRIASERIDILKFINMRCYNLDALVCDTSKFLRFVSNGIDKVKATDTFIMLSKELNQPLEQVKKQLEKSKFIEYISIASIKANLDYLRKLSFSDEEIWRNIHLLLYPKDVIFSNIMKIHMGEFAIYVDGEKLTIHKKHYLSLALYCIEREHHFVSSNMWEPGAKIESIEESSCLPF